MRIPPKSVALVLAAVAVAAGAVAAVTLGAMRSTKIDHRLCETVGGGRFVPIPGFPGERIDRRLLRDVRYLVRRYDIFVTDGYSTAPYHAKNGEHPIGLALDIVPNELEGGSWRKITRLARWAEPRRNRPRLPFRWVGYNGDKGHGRGDHLHLSWAHSETKPRDPARTVYTIRCPGDPTPHNDNDGKDGDGQNGDGEPKDEPETEQPDSPTGGSDPSTGDDPPTGGLPPSSGDDPPTGGSGPSAVKARIRAIAADPVPERR